MAPLFLVFPFLALFAMMMLAAALTFTVTSTVPTLRRHSITAPIAAFLIAPSIALPLSLFFLQSFFIAKPPVGSPAFWIRFSIAFILVLAASLFAAKFGTLAARGLIEFCSPWLNNRFGLNPDLPVQSILLAGATLSILTLLGAAALIDIYNRESLVIMVTTTLIALMSAALCFRAILRLPQPADFRPLPLPPAIKRLLVRQR